jgi:AraC family transcriptional regulator of adaptative response / DNA-3-methyladenine glycosylase II
LLARRLLVDTKLPITEIAFAAGFNSLRRFNVLFKYHYGLNPTNFRQSITASESTESLIFELSYRSPFDWCLLLGFLNDHIIPRTEEIRKNY